MYKFKNRIMLPTLLLALALPLMGQNGPGKDRRGMGQGKALQELKLSEDQENQMQDLRFDHEKELIQLKADMKTAQLELKRLKQADNPNKKKIHAQIETVSQKRVAIEKARADHQLAIRKVLTQDQYKIFRKNMKLRAGRGDHHKDGKPGRRPHRN